MYDIGLELIMVKDKMVVLYQTTCGSYLQILAWQTSIVVCMLPRS